MIDLRNLCGLPVSIDLESSDLTYEESLEPEEELSVPLSELNKVLLNQSIKYPEKVYRLLHNVRLKEHKNTVDVQGFIYDLVFIPYGLLGIEYVKTHIYYSSYVEGKYDCIIEVYSGELTVLAQKNKENDDPLDYEKHVDDIKIIKVKPGYKLAIPTGFYYTFVNTDTIPVVFSQVSASGPKQVNYQEFQRERGLAYYIISKNARTEIVANPKYKVECCVDCRDCFDLESDESCEFLHSLLKTNKNPLYNLLVEMPDIIASIVI
jgi:oxalate decarboxylase/phosphoglucose isomerase-like protein (cupin superfamily)